jgi:hypothetical protein
LDKQGIIGGRQRYGIIRTNARRKLATFFDKLEAALVNPEAALATGLSHHECCSRESDTVACRESWR